MINVNKQDDIKMIFKCPEVGTSILQKALIRNFYGLAD